MHVRRTVDYNIDGTASKNYYVYSIRANNKVLYIGKGTTTQTNTTLLRCESHFIKSSNPRLRRYIAKYPDKEYVAVIEKSFYKEENAYNYERSLIKRYSNCFNITDGGDGGITHKGSKAYLLPDGNVVFKYKKPKGAIPYKSTFNKPVQAYDPKTYKITRYRAKEEVPSNLVLGVPKGIYNFGPKIGKIIVHKGTKSKYVYPDKIPQGWKIGRHTGSVNGMLMYHNKKTLEIKYFGANENVPKEFRKGNPKGIFVLDGKKYRSVGHAALKLDLSPFQIRKMRKDPNYVPKRKAS